MAASTTYKWIVKTSSKVDQAVMVIRIYCILHNLNPSDTGVLICAYIMVYGLNDKIREDIIRAGIIGKPSSLKNEIYTLRRMGILEGTGDFTRVSSKIVQPGLPSTTPRTLLLINLDNR